MRLLDGIFKTLFNSFVFLVAMFLLAPTLILVPISFNATSSIGFPPDGFTFGWYGSVFASAPWRAAILNSLLVAIATSVLSVALGTMAALSLSNAEFRLKPIVLGLLLSPLVTPVIVLAIGTYMVFARWGLSGTLISLVIAHTTLAIPFVIISVMANLKINNPNLTLASAGLGATPLFTFRRVTLPLILPGVASGAVFAFIISWDEVVMALFLTDVSTRTVPVMIWMQVRTMLDPGTAAVGSILIAISALVMIVSYRFRPERERR